MWKCLSVRRHSTVALWCVTLLCLLVLHFYFAYYNTAEKQRVFGRLRKMKLKARGTKLRPEHPLSLVVGNKDGQHTVRAQNRHASVNNNRDSEARDDEQPESKGNTNKTIPSSNPSNRDITTSRSESEENNDLAEKSVTQQTSPAMPNKLSVLDRDRKDHVKKLYSPPENESPRKRLPQAIVIGTGKCGTRALLEFLGMHPYVVIAPKEVHYFDRDENFCRGLSWYTDQMPPSYSDQMTLEKSPSYVEHERSAPEIYKMDQRVKFLWVVKDPVVRLMSAVALQQSGAPHHFYLERINQTLSIKTNNNAVSRGKYIVHLRKWLKFFPLSQIHILDGSDLRREPVSEIQAVEKFLKLPRLLSARNFYYNASRGFYCLVPFSARTPVCLGKSKGRRHPELNDTVKALLYAFYRPYNEEFFKVIGRRFHWEPEDYYS